MKRDNDWVEVVRRSLGDAEIPPPKGGWERIESELGGIPSGNSVRSFRWPRIAAAAAVVLICFVAGETLIRKDRHVDIDGTVIVSTDGGGQAAVGEIIPIVPDPEMVEHVVEEYHKVIAQRHSGVEPGNGITRSLPDADSARNCSAVADGGAAERHEFSAEYAEQQHPAKPADENRQPAEKQRVVTSRGGFANPVYDELSIVHALHKDKTSFGIFAAGGMTSGKDGRNPNVMYSAVDVAPGSDMTSVQRYSYTDCSFRHHQPLSFGLSVRREFSHGLSLETGVNYTLLRSDVRMKYGSDDMGQTLHFIGIPLRASWRFLERGRFSLYIGAGGMAEKCISAHLGSESVDEPKFQWSVNGAAGAQYKLGGLVGLYFEPEVSYYFTETKLRTARTESPLSLTLRLGVRFSF